MNRYLNENFQGYALRKKYKKVVTPVFTIGIPELERLLPYLQEFPISDVLESYYRADRTMTHSLSSSDVRILKDAKRGLDIIGEKFSKLAEEMQSMYFGQDPGGQPSLG
jgi:hypothetical protein